MPRAVNWVLIGLILLSLAGLINASFLAYRYYFAGPPACTIAGCEVVTTSAYAEIAGVSVALFGALYYLALAALACWLYLKSRRDALIAAFLLSLAGVLASAWFTYVQLVILKAICIYCLFSAAETLIIFLLIGGLLIRYRSVFSYNEDI